jgi:pilus assembly protein Flp/PilA
LTPAGQPATVPHRLLSGERDLLRDGDLEGKEVSHKMQFFNALINLLRREDEGQGLAEYALILALIAIVAIIALIFLGTQVSGILSTVGQSV